MKILVYGPKARYDAYMPDFAAQLGAELVFCTLDQSPRQAAAENPDAQVLFDDPIVDVGREIIDLLPNLKLIQSGAWPSTASTWRRPGSGAFMCATTRGATPTRWRSTLLCLC